MRMACSGKGPVRAPKAPLGYPAARSGTPRTNVLVSFPQGEPLRSIDPKEVVDRLPLAQRMGIILLLSLFLWVLIGVGVRALLT